MKVEQLIDEDLVWKQLEFLRVPKMSAEKLLDWARRDLISGRRWPGGRGKRRQWQPDTACDIFANVSLYNATGRTLAQVASVRRLSTLIQGCFSPAQILAMAPAFAKQEGAREMAGDVIIWTRSKRLAMRLLYTDTEPDFEKRRDRYFDSPDFAVLMFALCSGALDYRMEGNKLVAPREKKKLPEVVALMRFPRIAA